MVKIDELPEAVKPFARRAIGLREQNVRMIGLIQQAGVTVDLGTARTEAFINWMVENGILTEEARWLEAVDWEEKLRKQVQPMFEEIKKPKLIVPGRG